MRQKLKTLDPAEAKRLYAAALVTLEERCSVPPLLPEFNVCKSRDIYGNYLHLPRLIPPYGGMQAAIPHIPAAKTAPGLCGRLPVRSQYLVPQNPVRTLKRERHKEPQQLRRVHTRA